MALGDLTRDRAEVYWALRAQGLRQEAPPPADRAFWPGSWETSLQNHQAGRQHLPGATPVGGRRRRTLTPTCQPPVGPHSEDGEGSSSPSPAGVWTEPVGSRVPRDLCRLGGAGPRPPSASMPEPPAQSQALAVATARVALPAVLVAALAHPPADAAPCPAWCPRPRPPVWMRQGPEDSQAVLSGECWQPRYS